MVNLYITFAQARHKPVVCFAHVTNQMGNIEGDFEKGQDNGNRDALQVIAATARAWLKQQKIGSFDTWCGREQFQLS